MRVFVGLVIGLIAAAGVALAAWAGLSLCAVATGNVPQDADFTEARVSTLQAFLLAGGAVTTLALAAWRSWTAQTQADTAICQADNDEYGRRTDRYTAGVRMLGDQILVPRLGGVQLLAQLTSDDLERFGRPVCDTLAAFVRHPPYNWPTQPVAREWSERFVLGAADAHEDEPASVHFKLRADVNTAAVIVGDLAEQRRRRGIAPGDYRPNLETADLRGPVAPGATLSRMEINDVLLAHAKLAGADLRDTGLNLVDVRSADFRRADLADAKLDIARGDGASLDQANLAGATLKLSDRAPSALDAHASGATIDGNERAVLAELAGQLWAWRDDQPQLLAAGDPTDVKVRLFDEALRPNWLKGSDRERGFGPPKDAKPLQTPADD